MQGHNAVPPSSTASQAGTSAKEYPQTLLSERHIGAFERSFTFPGEVDVDKMNACLKDGLLRIVVPKTGNMSPLHRIIPVQSSTV